MKFKFIFSFAAVILATSSSSAYQIVCAKPGLQFWPKNAVIKIQETEVGYANLEVSRARKGQTHTENFKALVTTEDHITYTWESEVVQLTLARQSNSPYLKGVFTSEYGQQKVFCAFK